MKQLNKRCGAKCRNGRACKNLPVKDSKRCRMHGGLTPKGIASPHYKHGKFSRYVHLPQESIARIEKMQDEIINYLDESLRIQYALETMLWEKLDTGESGKSWKMLKKLFKSFSTTKNEGKKSYLLEQIMDVIDGNLSESHLLAEILKMHESQRKLSETIVKTRKNVQEVYTLAEWQEITHTLVTIIKNNVRDRETLGNIQRDLRNFSP